MRWEYFNHCLVCAIEVVLSRNIVDVMEWTIEVIGQFVDWWEMLNRRDRVSVEARMDMLEQRGPQFDHPYSSQILGSRHSHMRELRIQSGGDPIRIFYTFDPRRAAILLIGGHKTGSNRFYEQMIPIADRLYDEHLVEIAREGHDVG